MKLSEKQWKPFKINELFDVDKGIYLSKKDIVEGDIPFISAKASNNGVTGFIGNRTLFPKNSITIEKIKLSAFYQPQDYYCSHDVTVIQHDKLDEDVSLFICAMIKRQGVKYSYGRQAQMNVVKRETVLLPVDENENPDWEFMKTYVANKNHKMYSRYKDYCQALLKEINYQEVPPLHEKEWSEFRIGDLFTTIIGKNVDGNKINKETGKTAYITRKESNNGLDGFIDSDVKKLNTKYPVITIGNETARPFVQKYAFYTGTKVNILKSHGDISEYALLFIAGSLLKHKRKYSYSYTINSTRLKKQNILLPVNEKNEPDYAYMEQYIKNRMWMKYNQYSEFRNNIFKLTE
ncbi:MAG: restriction endonuclease subunit S [Alkaliphilus sp.]